jgi:hypothetical protein
MTLLFKLRAQARSEGSSKATVSATPGLLIRISLEVLFRIDQALKDRTIHSFGSVKVCDYGACRQGGLISERGPIAINHDDTGAFFRERV